MEDCACLVFLSDQLEQFGKKLEAGSEGGGGDGSGEGVLNANGSNVALEEDKVVDILRKSWKKMSEKGRELALGLEMGERARGLVGRALEGS